LKNFVYANSQRKSRLFAAAAAISSKQAAKQITKKCLTWEMKCIAYALGKIHSSSFFENHK